MNEWMNEKAKKKKIWKLLLEHTYNFIEIN